MKMFHLFVFFGFALWLCGCSGRDQYVAAKDKQLMARAIARAQSSQMMFVKALHSRRTGQSGFTIKKSFPVENDPDGEHMWLTNVDWDGKEFSATVANDPVETKAAKFGDKVKVRPDELTDWMYVENGGLVGGYTVRVLYQEATPDERKEFHRQLRCKIPPVDF